MGRKWNDNTSCYKYTWLLQNKRRKITCLLDFNVNFLLQKTKTFLSFPVYWNGAQKEYWKTYYDGSRVRNKIEGQSWARFVTVYWTICRWISKNLSYHTSDKNQFFQWFKISYKSNSGYNTTISIWDTKCVYDMFQPNVSHLIVQ